MASKPVCNLKQDCMPVPLELVDSVSTSDCTLFYLSLGLVWVVDEDFVGQCRPLGGCTVPFCWLLWRERDQPFHSLWSHSGIEATDEWSYAVFNSSWPVPHHTTGCVGLRWKISMAHRASLEHILLEDGLCFSSSVCYLCCFFCFCFL